MVLKKKPIDPEAAIRKDQDLAPKTAKPSKKKRIVSSSQFKGSLAGPFGPSGS